MRKPTAADPGKQDKAPSNLAAAETLMFHDCPNLMAFLVTVRYTDGSPRETGWYMVKVIGTSFQVILKDPTSKMQLSGVGQTKDDAFAAVELLLGLDNPPWEVDKYAQDRETRKPRK